MKEPRSILTPSIYTPFLLTFHFSLLAVFELEPPIHSLDFWTKSIFTLLIPAPLRLLPSINYKVLIYASVYLIIPISKFHFTTSLSLLDLPVPISYILYLPPTIPYH